MPSRGVSGSSICDGIVITVPGAGFTGAIVLFVSRITCAAVLNLRAMVCSLLSPSGWCRFDFAQSGDCLRAATDSPSRGPN